MVVWNKKKRRVEGKKVVYTDGKDRSRKENETKEI